MKTTQVITATMIAAATLLSGCASPYYPSGASQPAVSQPYPTTNYPAASRPAYRSYGVVDSIQMTQASANSNNGIGVGAVVGGVVGGLLGNQVGGGTGKAAATVAGVVGGAMVGNQMEQSNKVQMRDMYQIRVRLDNGSYQTINQESLGDIRIGSRVRVENNQVYRN